MGRPTEATKGKLAKQALAGGRYEPQTDKPPYKKLYLNDFFENKMLFFKIIIIN